MPMLIACSACRQLVPKSESKKGRCLACAKEHQRVDYRKRTRDGAWQYSSAWRKARKKALERDEYRCRFCDAAEDLAVHHILPVKQGGTHDLENLVVTCRSCHQLIEAELRRKGRAVL